MNTEHELNEPRQLTIKEAAAFTNRHTHTIRRWVREGRITSARAGGRVFVYEEDLLRMLAPAEIQYPGPGRHHPNDVRLSSVEAEVGQLRNSLVMLLDELGYGVHLDGLGHRTLLSLYNDARRELVSRKWTTEQMDKWAEISMRIQDDDIRFGFIDSEPIWRPIYLLLVAMRRTVKVETSNDRILRTKLDRAVAHIRSIVYTVSQTVDPEDRIAESLNRATKELGAVLEPTTTRLLVWLDTQLAA